MSKDIVINQHNLSKLTKRLKKNLDAYYSHPIPLHDVQSIFARMLGTSSLHELQQCLIKNKKPTLENKSAIKEIDGFGEYMESYLVVESNFFEKLGAPFFNHSDQYSIIDATCYQQDENRLFKDIFQALASLSNNTMMVVLYHKSTTPYSGISEFYFCKNTDGLYCYTMKGYGNNNFFETVSSDIKEILIKKIKLK